MTLSGRTSQRVAGEGERRFATAVTVRAILPGSAQTLMRVTEGGAEEEEEAEEGERASQCATAATGLVTLQGSAQRVTAVREVEMLEAQFATDVTGLATLPGSALRVMVDETKVVEVAMEEEVAVVIWDEVAAVDMEILVTLDVAATDTEGDSEVGAILAVVA